MVLLQAKIWNKRYSIKANNDRKLAEAKFVIKQYCVWWIFIVQINKNGYV